MAPHDGRQTVQRSVRVLRRAADELRRRTGAFCVTVVGHSQGGLIAYRYAAAFPTHVCRVVTFGSPLQGSSLADHVAAPSLFGSVGEVLANVYSRLSLWGKFKLTSLTLLAAVVAPFIGVDDMLGPMREVFLELSSQGVRMLSLRHNQAAVYTNVRGDLYPNDPIAGNVLIPGHDDGAVDFSRQALYADHTLDFTCGVGAVNPEACAAHVHTHADALPPVVEHRHASCVGGSPAHYSLNPPPPPLNHASNAEEGAVVTVSRRLVTKQPTGAAAFRLLGMD